MTIAKGRPILQQMMMQRTSCSHSCLFGLGLTPDVRCKIVQDAQRIKLIHPRYHGQRAVSIPLITNPWCRDVLEMNADWFPKVTTSCKRFFKKVQALVWRLKDSQ